MALSKPFYFRSSTIFRLFLLAAVCAAIPARAAWHRPHGKVSAECVTHLRSNGFDSSSRTSILQEIPEVLMPAYGAIKAIQAPAPVDALIELFSNPEFVPVGGVVTVAVPSLDIYEILIPLVQEGVQVHVTSGNEDWELPLALLEHPRHLTRVYEEIEASNPRLLQRLQVERPIELLHLIHSRVHFRSLADELQDRENRADVILARGSLQSLEFIENIAKPHCLLWIASSDRSRVLTPKVMSTPFLVFSSLDAHLANFGERNVQDPFDPVPSPGLTTAQPILGPVHLHAVQGSTPAPSIEAP